MDRSIIHLNIADFAVAVERLSDARLRGRPVIVAPEGVPRAGVHDMSEEAYRAGVRKGMRLESALRRSPDAVVRPPDTERCRQVMAALVGQALSYSPRIEQGEADGHLFVDVTGTSRLFGPPVDVAWRLRNQSRDHLGLDPIWSVAPNKLVAKVATRLVKPSGEYIVAHGEEAAFLAPLPLHLVPGIYPEDLACLREFNLTRVFQVTALDLEALRTPFGRRAMDVYEAVRGIDPSPVRAVDERPPVVAGVHAFGEDTLEPSVLEGALYALVEAAGADLRRRRMAAGRLSVTLTFSDGIRTARQRAVAPPSANDIALFELARSALYLAWTRRTRVRRVRLLCSRLAFPPAQLSLFPEEQKSTVRRHRLVDVMDRIRDRFGPGAVRVGRTLAAGGL
ncbi:MAG: DNA polymerase Y family protein [Desulfobacterales bacterium]